MYDSSLTITAPAKLNLNLNIIGTTDKGYHLLESVAVFTKDGDTLVIKVNDLEQDSLSIQGIYAPLLSTTDNLIIKAVNLLRKHKSFPCVDIYLNKILPIQAGYGGGSSNAAAILKALNKMFELGFSLGQLCDFGIQLGADIPMCLYAKPCFVQGFGEQITPLKTINRTYYCLLLKPDFMCSTQEIFQNLQEKNNPKMPMVNNKIVYALEKGRNDLFSSAVILNPILEKYLNTVKQTNPVKAAMSGSGSGFFALYKEKDHFDKEFNKIKTKFPNNFIMKTQIDL